MTEELYAIVVKRAKQDYYLPMSLEKIDEYFTKYKRVGVLSMMRDSDSVLTETDSNLLSIKKIVNGNLIEDKNTEIIEDSFYLDFSLKELPLEKDDKFTNVLYNRLEPYKTKKISNHFKNAIDSLKLNRDLFLAQFGSLAYSEQRIIRTVIAKNINLFDYIEEENIIRLQRIKEEENAA